MKKNSFLKFGAATRERREKPEAALGFVLLLVGGGEFDRGRQIWFSYAFAFEFAEWSTVPTLSFFLASQRVVNSCCRTEQ
jgi:hypothetical protein